jgi:hypothetical protein
MARPPQIARVDTAEGDGWEEMEWSAIMRVFDVRPVNLNLLCVPKTSSECNAALESSKLAG